MAQKDMIDPSFRYKRQHVQVVHRTKYGGMTILNNTTSICKSILRDVKSIRRFLSKITNSNVRIIDGDLVLSGIHDARELDDKIERFIELYVLCKKCGNPETNESDGYCTACGYINTHIH